ncbi:MAG: sulfite oxidase [Pseudomonadota bacterium]
MPHANQPPCGGGLRRRAFLRLMGLGFISLGGGVSVLRQGLGLAGAATAAAPLATPEARRLLDLAAAGWPGVKLAEVTPNDQFYLTHYDGVPRPDPSTWRLRVEGLVDRPDVYTLAEIKDLTDHTAPVTLACIGNPVGGTAIGNAVWQGVTLKKLLERHGVKAGAVDLVLYAEDGYSDSFPVGMALDGECFLAWGMNGSQLPAEHGYPLRAVVPGIYGMKNVKWLTKLEVADHDHLGYWEDKGWSDTAVIHTISQVLMPADGARLRAGDQVLAGIAFAGRRGIRKVEVSTDGGDTWQAAELKEPLGPFAWRLWRFQWQAQRGSHTVKVRATDGQGQLQETGGFFARSFPDGARGIHGVDVSVR